MNQRGWRPARCARVLCAALVVTSCTEEGRPAGAVEQAHDTASALAAARGVTVADSGAAARDFRVIPLSAMTGDVEVVYGDPEKAGPFVMRIRELPGTRIPLHSHPVDEHLTIVDGTFYFAVGETWDRALLREMKSGAYAFIPAGSTMFGYAPEGAIVQVHGNGPFHIVWRHGSRALDNPADTGAFAFRIGDRVTTARGPGTLRQGYASGDIVQYEIELDGAQRVMVDEKDLRKR